MSVKNKTNKNDKRSQKGRSMVEMLGVLAIIGVLSVGGLYGYGVAMKKHKANELLHQASMLATTISAQAMTNNGSLPSTITNFGSTSNGTFETTVGESADKTQFILTITGLDDGVCKQLESMAGGMMRSVECSEPNADNKVTATLSYYKNLATTKEEGEKSPTGEGVEIDPCDLCEEDQECIDGICIKSKTTDGTCAKNSDCDVWCETNGWGYPCYCKIEATSTGNDSSCYNNFVGTCNNAFTKDDIPVGYAASYDDMNWWSAVNFCKVYDMQIISLSNLGITGGYEDGYCSDWEPDDKCMGINWSYWQEKLNDVYSSWLIDSVSCQGYSCRPGTDNNSCNSFVVDYYAYIATSERKNLYSAVCTYYY